MKGKMNLFLAGLVLAGLGVFLMVEGAEAFCVYNKTDKQITVIQTSGHKKTHGFSLIINRGDSECCNWKNSDCNKEGKKDSIVKFNVFYQEVRPPDRKIYDMDICEDFPIKAGGWLTVEGSGGNYKCVAHE